LWGLTGVGLSHLQCQPNIGLPKTPPNQGDLQQAPDDKKLQQALRDIATGRKSVDAIIDLRFNFTALHVATLRVSDSQISSEGKEYCLKIMRMLTKKGANLNLRDIHGRAAIHIAAQYGPVEAVQLLVDAGAKLDMLENKSSDPRSNAKGWAPLHQVADRAATPFTGKDLITIVEPAYKKLEILLEGGADPNFKDRSGKSPLQIAEELPDSPNKARVVQRLQEAMAARSRR